MTRSRLVLAGVLAALLLAGCGGDDEPVAGVDMGAFEGCLERHGLERGRAPGVELRLDPPVELFYLEGANPTDYGIYVQPTVAVYESEEDALAAAASFGSTLIASDSTGPVLWLYPNVTGGIDADTSTTLSACAAEAG